MVRFLRPLWVGALMLAACSSAQHTTLTNPTLTPPAVAATLSQPASPTAGAASPTPRPTTAAAIPSVTPSSIRQDFVGTWHVHGSSLQITSRTQGQLTTFNVGQCLPNGSSGACGEHDALSLVLSPDSTRLTATLTKVTYFVSNGAGEQVVPNANVSTPNHVGDAFRLEFVGADLMKTTILRGLQGYVGGNPYWCGAHPPTPPAGSGSYCGA
ncbi:MAG: hypothetical protein NVSMB32_11020 [Actinomycetota bacterium]